jgi:hypothetical protein
MKYLGVALWLFSIPFAYGQINKSPVTIDLNANGEQIVFLPHGGIASPAVRKEDVAKPAFDEAPPISRPRPYFFGGMQLDGNGAAMFNYAVALGIQQETKRYSFDAFAQYENTRKIDDNTVNNHSGRTRILYGAPRYRLNSNWFVGGGARWSDLSTTNYVKQSWSPFVGGGKDWDMGRMSLDYLWTGSEHVSKKGCSVANGQCTNASRGFDFQWIMPSPKSRRHVLFRIDFLPIVFHTTVTSSDPALTRRQQGEGGIASWLEYTLLFRY